MPRRVEPPAAEHEAVCDNDGELFFVNYLLRHLPEEWEVYVQPPLNGRRPDVIVLHPQVGIGVFEVKDWNLALYRTDGGRIVGTSQQGDFPTENPCYQVQAYRKQVLEVLAPSLSAAAARNPAAFGCIQVGVIFTHAQATTVQARQLLHPHMSAEDQRYIAVVGRDTLDRGAHRLSDVLRDACREHSRFFTPEIAEEFRRWISEPEAEREQREPLDLTEQQREIAETRTRSGFRRVRGAAGSGKSQALAARAAHLALEGKDVLVCAFNITMVNYLPDIAVRYPNARVAVRRRAHFTWFHQWCGETVVELGGKEAWSALFIDVPEWDVDRVLVEDVPAEVQRLARLNESTLRRYDAILVDEGQDWLPSWWNTVRLFLRPGGEMLLVADQTQDLYDRSGKWTDQAMRGAGFPGGAWFQLQGSHRVHPAMVPMLDDFVTRFLPGGEVPAAVQLELGYGGVRLFWVDAKGRSPGKWASAILARLTQLNGGRPIAYPDCTVMVASHEEGMDLLRDLALPGAEVGHVFDPKREVQRGLKVKFRKGMGRLKAATVHSFKGWEDRALIVVVQRFKTKEDRALVYTALSRLNRSQNGALMVVLSYVPELAPFGAAWFNPLKEDEFFPKSSFENDIPF